MPEFLLTVKFKKKDLVAAMAKHGVSNVVVESGADVDGVIEFLLDAINVTNIRIGEPSHIYGENEYAQVQFTTGSYVEGWHAAVRDSLKRLDDHVSKR